MAEEQVWAYTHGRLKITMGIPGNVQESAFMNATLQDAGGRDPRDTLDFSIAVHVDVPPDVVDQGEEALADYLGNTVFGDFVHQHPEVKIEIQIGPYGESGDWEP